MEPVAEERFGFLFVPGMREGQGVESMSDSTLNRVSKVKSSNQFDGWDYTMDGRFRHPRVKGRDKQLRNKTRRRIEKHLLTKEVAE